MKFILNSDIRKNHLPKTALLPNHLKYLHILHKFMHFSNFANDWWTNMEYLSQKYISNWCVILQLLIDFI